MYKRGYVETAILLVVAFFAVVGVVYVLNPGSASSGMLMIPPQDQPGMMKMPMLSCQSTCFGRPVGQSYVGQQGLGGAALRQCLADCQAGIPYTQQLGQECYTCSCPSEGITADNYGQAQVVCQRVCGSEAQITNTVSGPCNYS